MHVGIQCLIVKVMKVVRGRKGSSGDSPFVFALWFWEEMRSLSPDRDVRRTMSPRRMFARGIMKGNLDERIRRSAWRRRV